MSCQVQHHQYIKSIENILVSSIKRRDFHCTCPSIFIDFTFLFEIIFLKIGFYALLCMSRIMLPYHEILIREGGRAKRDRCWPYQTIIIII